MKASLNRKYLSPIGIAIVVGLVFAYTNYFGSQTVLQTNTDHNCKQGNVLDGVDRQMRFFVLSTCEKASGIVHI